MDFLSGLMKGMRSAQTPTASDLPPAQAAPPAATPAPAFTDAILGDARVPAKCRAKANAIAVSIDVLQGRMASASPADESVRELRRIREADLQEILQRYVDIPEEHRAEIFRRTGKSASYHLGESLDVLAAKVSEVSRELAQGVLDQFTNSTKFVENQYGHHDDPFA